MVSEQEKRDFMRKLTTQIARELLQALLPLFRKHGFLIISSSPKKAMEIIKELVYLAIKMTSDFFLS